MSTSRSATVRSESAQPPRVAYLVKRYPRFSETFIVNEILAHEDAGLELDLYSLKPSNDTHFQNAISRVRAPLELLSTKSLKASTLWHTLGELRKRGLRIPAPIVDEILREPVTLAFQAIVLAQRICERRIQHIHAHFGTSPATVARLAAGLAGVGYSFTAHAKDLFHESFCRKRFVDRHFDSATIVTISEFNRRFLLEDCGFAPGSVHVVRNGLDLDVFRYARNRHERRGILAIGRLVEKKGFGDLILACAHLRELGVDFQCRIIGTGPIEHELREKIEATGLADRVQLLGALPQETARAILKESAVFAAPCVVASDGDRDGVPTTILEAMAVGVPCVATDVTGIPEVVVEMETGLIVGQRDPKGLARSIQRLLADQDLARRLSKAARKKIEKEYDARVNTARLRDLFDRSAQKLATPPVPTEGRP